MLGGKVIWAQDADGEIGRQPQDEGLVWIDGATYVHAMQQADYLRTRKAKRGDVP